MPSARPGRYAPLGYEQITSMSTVKTFTVPSRNATGAKVIAESQDVRWTDDGTTPTSSVGMLWKAGIEYFYDGNLNAVQAIEATASAKLNVSYYEDTRSGQ